MWSPILSNNEAHESRVPVGPVETLKHPQNHDSAEGTRLVDARYRNCEVRSSVLGCYRDLGYFVRNH